MASVIKTRREIELHFENMRTYIGFTIMKWIIGIMMIKHHGFLELYLYSPLNVDDLYGGKSTPTYVEELRVD